MFKYYNFLIIIFLFSAFGMYANNVGQVYAVEEPDSKIIYFGPLLKGNLDTMHFVVQSYLADTTLIIRNVSPTFILANSPNSNTSDDYFSFSFGDIINQMNNFPFNLDKNKLLDTIKIPFMALTEEPDGRREARLIIGFLYIDDAESPTALYTDTFFLIAKNTSKYLDSYDDFVKFDSVFINQTNPVIKKLKVKNTYTTNINAITQNWNLISQQYTEQEFFIPDATYPLTFYVGNNKEWDVGYSPQDTLPDTAEVRIIFIPNANEPSKLDTVITKLYGVGVQQSFNVVQDSNCVVVGNADTIDIGSIRVGTTKTAFVKLRNVGNINYGLVRQNIYDEINDISVDYFNIQLPFCKDTPSLKINDVDSFAISFRPDKKGNFIARYILENDFKDRKILSNNINDYKKIIILKGIGVEPILQLEKDTIDFGNVSYANANQDCPTKKDTIITLFNIGNAEIIINDIRTNNPVFQVVPTNISIPASASAQIQITFNSNAPENLHNATLIFETNDNILTQKITLFGTSIPPIIASMSIPHISLKPGTILEIPIELVNNTDNSSVSQYASNFSISLNYNPALLSYNNYITFGTASEGCNIEVNEFSNGNIEINGGKTSNLQQNTTLLKLRFRTFLGDKPTTEIAISNAKLGINDICDDYIKLNLNNGSYSIDSICGLEYKLNNIGRDKYDYSITKNDNENIEINFNLPFEIPVQLTICNYLGSEVLKENYFLPQGTYTKFVPLLPLNAGIYYTIFQAGLYYKVIPFIKW
ncbi:MAG: hypothetical protein FWG85_02200 [Bacteroidetes bacterium]|nr:hypothetical protein [Bacteroidota bacterium]